MGANLTVKMQQGKEAVFLHILTDSLNNNKKIKEMDEKVKTIVDAVTANVINTTKEVLTSDEAARYMGISKSWLYKMTMRKQIPHYKPSGKVCYFNRKELEAWLQSNRIATDSELTKRAADYCMKGGKK